MKKNFLLLLMLTAWLCGCVSVDYVGQRLAPRADGDFVMLYPSMQEVPADLKILGRGKIIAPQGYDMDKLDELMTEKALEVGADAVAIASQKRVIITSDNHMSSQANNPHGSWNFRSTTLEGDPVYTDSFGKQQSLQVVKTERYRIYYQIVFLTKQDIGKKEPVVAPAK